MLVGLSMILVFSEATDVSYNVRLWARHLAMATIVLQAAEVSSIFNYDLQGLSNFVKTFRSSDNGFDRIE